MEQTTTQTRGAAIMARTMPELVAELASRWPDGIAAIDERSEITYPALLDRADRIARALAARGVTRGDRIGLLSGNGIDWLAVAFGGAMAGAAVVPFSTWSTRSELDFLVTDSACKALFVTADFCGHDFTADIDALDDLDETVLVSIGTGASSRFEELAEFSADVDPDQALTPARPEDDSLILYTSGSTSRPKGVRLRQDGLVENGFHIGERMGLCEADRVFLPAPLFWAYGGCNAMPAAMSHGATLILPERFEAGQALAMMERHRATAIYTLPTITTALLGHPDFSPSATASLRTGLTIGSPEDFRLAADRLGASDLCNIYGATETYGNCAVTWHHWPKERRAVCQGPMLPGQEIRFRDPETGMIVPQGQPGLAEVCGRISPGYAGAAAELNTAAFTEDGYYRTGDMARLDQTGAVVFIGRASEMIKRAGINVSPAEIEDVLMRHPEVRAAAVVGVPDSARGESIVALVVTGSATTHRDALIEHCREYLSKYKIPDRIEIVENLPATATGKLQRRTVKDMAAALMAREGRQ